MRVVTVIFIPFGLVVAGVWILFAAGLLSLTNTTPIPPPQHVSANIPATYVGSWSGDGYYVNKESAGQTIRVTISPNVLTNSSIGAYDLDVAGQAGCHFTTEFEAVYEAQLAFTNFDAGPNCLGGRVLLTPESNGNLGYHWSGGISAGYYHPDVNAELTRE